MADQRHVGFNRRQTDLPKLEVWKSGSLEVVVEGRKLTLGVAVNIITPTTQLREMDIEIHWMEEQVSGENFRGIPRVDALWLRNHTLTNLIIEAVQNGSLKYYGEA
jgi:hypothetical protein